MVCIIGMSLVSFSFDDSSTLVFNWKAISK